MKRIVGICLTPVLLVSLLSVLLYVPAVQQFALKKATRYASESLGMTIEAEHLRLSYPLHLTVRNVSVRDSLQDTLLFVRKLSLKVSPLPLLKKEIWISSVQLEEASVHTKQVVDGLSVDGRVGRFSTSGNRVLLLKEEMRFDRITLADADVTLQIDSIASSDTTDNQVRWKIMTDGLRLQQVAFSLRMPSDSLHLSSYIEDALLTDGTVDLAKEMYGAKHIHLSDGTIRYDQGNEPRKAGLDMSHLDISQMNMNLDSVFYREKDMRLQIRDFSMNERSGLSVTSLTALVRSDSTALSVPACVLRTSLSSVDLQAFVPWNALSAKPEGVLLADLQASLHRTDVLTAMGERASSIAQKYPDSMLTLVASVEGNSDKLRLHRLKSSLPGVFQLEAYGIGEKLKDDVNRSGTMSLTMRTGDHSFLKKWLPEVSDGRLTFPDSLNLEVEAALAHGEYQTDMLLSHRKGGVRLSGHYNTIRKNYAVDLKVDSLNPIYFLPKDSIFLLTASLRAEGKGTDFFSGSTQLMMDGELTQLNYKNTLFSGLSVDGSFSNHQLQAKLTSEYPYLKGSATLDGSVHKEKISGMLIVDMDSLDFNGLNITEKPFSNSFQLFSEMETDLKKQHRLDVTLGNWEMALEKQKVRPKTLTLHATSDEDTSRVSFHSGDLGIVLTGNANLEMLVGKLNDISNAFQEQIKKDTVAYLQYLTPLFPELDLQIEAGRDNPLHNYLQDNDFYFDRFSFRASTSPQYGVHADGTLLSLMKDTMKIDTVRLRIWQDSIDGIRYACRVTKNKFRRQQPFTAGLHGSLQTGKGNAEVYYRDARGETGVHLGVSAIKLSEGFRFEFFPENPVLAFMPFTLNKGNYVEMRNLKDISADLKLVGEKNASFWVHSMETDGKMDELFIEVNQIDLRKASRFTGLPMMEGIANVALRYMPVGNSFMVAADANVDNLIYEGGRIGELLLNGVYLPLEKNQHQFDAHLFHDQAEIATVSALYNSSKKEKIEGLMSVDRMPLEMLNPFFAEKARLKGFLKGSMALTGTERKPLWNGYLQMDTALMYLPDVGTQIRFDNRKIKIKDSEIRFNKYGLYANGNNPFMIDGKIDISRPMYETVDLKLNAHDMKLLDTRKTPESMLYGKMLVNLNTTLKGSLRSLRMRGNIHLLAGTNVTYVVPEDKLEARDNFTDLVSFTYFSDTIPKRKRWGIVENDADERRSMVPIDGVNGLFTIRIDPAVRLKIDMGGEQANRIELKGGGELSFQYSSLGDMALNGRYTISEGLVRYNIPVIPLTDFTIRSGSSVEWRGNPMNPVLNLTALSRLRSSVNMDGQSQMVDFNAGIQVRQQLENPSLKFLLEAPNNAVVQNQLTAMGEEERSKRAISLLVAGVYLSSGNTGLERVDVGAALSSLLQREINNMLGSLLGEVPVSFDVNTYDGTDGQGRRIDYLGRFYKGFMDDRLYSTLGMRFSTNDPVSGNRFYIDEASLEYRLDNEGSRFIRVFSEKDYQNLFEGEIRKNGVNIIFRRKIKRIGDLFDLRKQPAIKNEEETEETEILEHERKTDEE